jgi:uncharacterized delta-60 repeat protein
MKTSTASFASDRSRACSPGTFTGLLCIAGVFAGELLVAQESVTPGTIDPTFQSQITRDHVEAVLVHPNGFLSVGARLGIPGVGANLIRLTQDGKHDQTFAPTSGVPWKVARLALQRDGKLLVGNKGGVDGSYPAIGLSRFLQDGTKDPSFRFHLPTNSINNGLWSGFWTTALTVQPDGRILLAGHYERDHFDYWYWSAVTLQRLQPDGSEGEFLAFNWPAPRFIEVFCLLPDQRLLVGGDQLARLNADGREDTGFLKTILSTGVISCCVTQADGRVLIGGSFTEIQGHARSRVARILADGQLDLSFNPPVIAGSNNPDSTAIRALAVQPDRRILVGGAFETVNGLPYAALARLNFDGSLDAAFPPIVRPDEDEDIGVVSNILLQDGNRALVAGGNIVTAKPFQPRGLFRIHLGEPALRLHILQVPSGTVQLTFPNPDGYAVTVLSSTNPSLPLSDWTVVGLATNAGADLFQFTDPLVPSEAQRFYRLHRVTLE